MGLAISLVILGSCSCGGRTADESGSSNDSVPADLPATIGVDLSVRGNVSCAVLDDGRAKCWGRGTWAQHGQQTTEALGDDESAAEIPFLALDASVESISTSYMSVCAVLEGRRSFRCWGGLAPVAGAWGYPFTGILGDDEPILAGELISVSSAIESIDISGRAHTCILLEGGSVKCFGANAYGQLGYGHTDTLCDEIGETVDALPSVDVGGPVAQLAMGETGFSCARLVDGTVRCWGRNAAGILGHQLADSESIGDDEVPSSYPPIELAGEPVVQLSTGPTNACAVHANGALSCWGLVSAALGYGSAVANEFAIGDTETPASVGHVDVGGPVEGVALGNYHTCALLDDGGVKCWGVGTLVALGYGTTETIGDDESPAVLDPLPLGAPAVSIHAGEFHSCAVLQTGDVKCWGHPAAALGYGDGNAPIGDDETLEDLGPVPLIG
ncbi:RCC1 domain-containing protein [Enhygromyxa salina]|nr:hypothetical protein [Enhygromyxa salina]